uniref:Uncharacterized protein n=1 Tax=mine drainage metagenome TaxID=410659 RepID=E6Q059_9ZZZZ
MTFQGVHPGNSNGRAAKPHEVGVKLSLSNIS